MEAARVNQEEEADTRITAKEEEADTRIIVEEADIRKIILKNQTMIIAK